ncbi:hypothetical protein AEAC466_14395 [Asticcacaulis sp. AC466]|uniref:hypothetical protein n=1 Tax=Asticcacaulis sp. AC466 TaxID=1282362 RepID=UPI0003C3DEEE|nr:hypothetical protein [Asticcacaulis sp. AC466]ESQ83049.1 hypothetical protein AEAC466_14395 [Asticcacaulis sp. AC466]
MEKKPAILFGTPKAPAVKSDRPKILAAGKARTRLPCSVQALKALDEGASPGVLAEALEAVNGVNLDDHHFDDVVRFGAGLQTEHGKLAEAELDLVSDDALTSIKATYLELIDRLEKLDPRRVFTQSAGPFYKVQQFFQGGSPERSFEVEYSKIKALSESLEGSMPVINRFVETLARLGRRYAVLSQSVKAHVLACRFIVTYIDTSIREDRDLTAHYQSQRDALVNREASLFATGATLQIGQQTLSVLSRSIDELGLSGQNFTREELPAWYGAFSAALLAKRVKSQDSGLFDAVLKAHQHLLSKIKRPT